MHFIHGMLEDDFVPVSGARCTKRSYGFALLENCDRSTRSYCDQSQVTNAA